MREVAIRQGPCPVGVRKTNVEPIPTKMRSGLGGSLAFRGSEEGVIILLCPTFFVDYEKQSRKFMIVSSIFPVRLFILLTKTILID